MKALEDENFKYMGQKSDTASIDKNGAYLASERAVQFKFAEGCWWFWNGIRKQYAQPLMKSSLCFSKIMLLFW